jgi:catechol 2,3-dioxygenase-like lactoylglutathione lyase family enzyme
MPQLGSTTVTQVGMIVKDIEKSAKLWAGLLGVPVPEIVVTDELDKAQTVFRGKPSPARAKLAFIHLGPQVDMELIEPDGNPSTWQEFLDEHGEGVHHIAFNVQGMKEQTQVFAAHGLDCVQKGEYTGGRYAYFDAAENKFNVVFELLEND